MPSSKSVALLADADHGRRATLNVFLAGSVSLVNAAATAEALTQLVAFRPDLAIIGVGCPGVDPVLVLRAIRIQCPLCQVVVIGAVAAPALTAAGARRVLAWPDGLGALLGIFAGVIRNADPRVRRPFSTTARRALGLIARDYREITVPALAGSLGVSCRHLSRVFQHTAGLTPAQHILRVRLEVCRQLLTRTDASLDRLADLTGFCDAAHLSRRFRQYTGMNPGEYRRRHVGRPATS